MDLELVTIGTELLLGFTIDTNSAFAGQALAEIGVRITRRTSVPDEPGAVRDAVGEALARSRLVITTGGLGPTRDDLSKNAVAELLGLPLEFRPEIWEALTVRWSRMGRKISERNRCQAEVPRGATVLPNPRGTAPGLWITADRGEVIMLPGVPSEMRGLVRDEVVPRLAARSSGRVVRSLVLRTTGIPESALAERLAPVEEGLAPLTLAYLPSLEGVDLRLTAWDATPEAAGAALSAGATRLREPLGDHCYAEGETDLAAVLLDACRAHRLTVAVAESCTGGMVGERITEIAGSSDVFRGGVIAYANGVKEAMLHVPARILEAEGAVSEGTARAMAEAAQSQLGASLAVAVSGVAGPTGGSDEKPVGTVWFAFAGPRGTEAERVVFPGSRHEIRVRASQYALFGLLRLASRGR
ncbi:MAG: competence/damage-inducible protein A [Gemmatimonadetes bacterium]|nr:MAG: competence/damage-inducible protein A [Gemmatimonadota bacterium]